MGITEVAPNKDLSPYVQLKAGLFDRVLRYIAISEEEFRNYQKRTRKKDYPHSWGTDKDPLMIVLNEQFLKGLGNISLSLYRDLVNADEKDLADEVVERSRKETEQASQV